MSGGANEFRVNKKTEIKQDELVTLKMDLLSSRSQFF